MTKPNKELGGFATDQEAWESGHVLLLALKELRFPIRRATIQPGAAEAAIREYCQRLRRSDPTLSLPRIQHEFRVPDYGVVLILFSAACFWGLPGFSFNTFQDAVALAVGFNPAKMIQTHIGLESGKGFYGLLEIDCRGHLDVSRKLFNFIRGQPFTDSDMRKLKWQIGSMPTALDEQHAPAKNLKTGEAGNKRPPLNEAAGAPAAEPLPET